MVLQSFPKRTLKEELLSLMRRHPKGVTIGQAAMLLGKEYMAVSDTLWPMIRNRECNVTDGRFWVKT